MSERVSTSISINYQQTQIRVNILICYLRKFGSAEYDFASAELRARPAIDSITTIILAFWSLPQPGFRVCAPRHEMRAAVN